MYVDLKTIDKEELVAFVNTYADDVLNVVLRSDVFDKHAKWDAVRLMGMLHYLVGAWPNMNDIAHDMQIDEMLYKRLVEFYRIRIMGNTLEGLCNNRVKAASVQLMMLLETLEAEGVFKDHTSENEAKLKCDPNEDAEDFWDDDFWY